MSAPENPPAFPNRVGYGTDAAGMTVRDYFAIHCDQPGTAEIATAAGLSMKSPAGVFVILPDGTEIDWATWWNGLTAADRFALYAKVRYAIADAMLAQRKQGPSS